MRQRPLAETYSPQQTQTTTQQTQQQNVQQQPQPTPQPTQQQQPTQQATQQNQQHRYHADYPGNGPNPSQHQGSPVPQIHPQQLMHQQPLNVHRNNVSQPHGPSPPHQAIQQQHSQQVHLSLHYQ
ncbi:hypothetical protein RR48_00469 [Papilio machaon]|uniref:Uncharacterized protein n=1 Tax=Papilio machaon TaxID=76193 RepID=A0A0N1IHZ3_PAPMA|nr:hypothetical protein RR48_00469 [Papilio machaon]